ncbi:hypothetical protein C8J57DRAFT_1215114 [Mycena rebaudengoi]|nr:hypothetical protein C8J57DRAFT_1215114 [Mycena rebaudengoi]
MAPPVTSILSGKFVLRSRESEFNPKAVLVVCVRDWRISTTIVDHNMGAHGNSAPPEADLRQAQEIWLSSYHPTRSRRFRRAIPLEVDEWETEHSGIPRYMRGGWHGQRPSVVVATYFGVNFAEVRKLGRVWEEFRWIGRIVADFGCGRHDRATYLSLLIKVFVDGRFSVPRSVSQYHGRCSELARDFTSTVAGSFSETGDKACTTTRPKQNDRSPSFAFRNLNNADEIMKGHFPELLLLQNW